VIATEARWNSNKIAWPRFWEDALRRNVVLRSGWAFTAYHTYLSFFAHLDNSDQGRPFP